MQWVFLVLGLVTALAELHTGTFYLAAVAAVALATYVLGFWLAGKALILSFAVGCVVAAALVWAWHQRSERVALADFDAGQDVIVASVIPGEPRLTVSYRGTRWDAVMDEGPPPEVGSVLRIRGKNGSVLHVGHREPMRKVSS